MKYDTFTLPFDFTGQSEKIAVVSIVGHSCYSSFGQKTKPLRRVFGGDTKTNGETLIEGFYDEPNQLIYLHLRGLYDTSNLIKNYENLVNKCLSSNETCSSTVDFNTVYNEVKNEYARSLFLLFHISHIIVVSHPGSTFDLSYLQLFKTLENARQKRGASISEILRTIPDISPEWIQHRRLCTPRLVFYFEKCPKQLLDSGKSGSIKKLEHAVEDKIYHVLRKAKILINNSSNCLFAIPLNQEYVYINTEISENNDKLSYAVQSLLKSCNVASNSSANLHCSSALTSLDFTYSSQTNEQEKRSFLKFLQMHTNHAFAKGFDDNMGRNTARAHFELPNVEVWFKVANKLYEFCCGDQEKADAQLLKGLTTLYVDTRFSDQRCLKVLPLAFARYQENLPSHYTRAYHENRLAIAMAVFTNHARGSMFEKYSKQLVEDCTQHFENGRQLCEHPSLTGNPCTLPKHDSEKEHCSGVRYIAACDCGGSQGPREDPYNLRNANHTFYSNLRLDCLCGKLERIEFPIFQPSIQEYKAASLFTSSLNVHKTRSVDLISSDHLSDISENGSDLLDPLKTGGLTPPHPHSEMADTVLELLEESDSKDKNLVRQPSTTEYLPGMLTLTSPAGLLPQFPSWSLVCLGPSSLYSHNVGLTDSQHPGFLSGSNFLLPWDVVIKTTHGKSIWPSGTDNRKHSASFSRSGQRKNKQSLTGSSSQSNTNNEVTVKVFVGIEYECPRGHRFMMSSPDKILRATSGIVKESGHRVTTSDMPLYYNCPCRLNKPLIAQLMRVHIVSPKNLVFITLNPKVQPGPGASIFVPRFNEPIKLTQSTYWVLRLPYVYVADREPYLPPLNIQTNQQLSARLLQGMWGVINV